ncbi:hypothetical protein [Synechococcus sp. WH 8016]|uniref:hypothetical protein n=1 Tax=Synechococcus sp. WH 8016 TaxID=166318 RepID=UPI0002FC8B5D|nr:hypothetical protein [Synechococcus sp. WH 8016]
MNEVIIAPRRGTRITVPNGCSLRLVIVRGGWKGQRLLMCSPGQTLVTSCMVRSD